MVVYYYFSFKIIVARGSMLYYIQLFMLIVTEISVVRYACQPGTPGPSFGSSYYSKGPRSRHGPSAATCRSLNRPAIRRYPYQLQL